MTLKKILPLAMTLAIVLPAGQAFAAPKPKFRFQAATYVVAENSASLPVSGQNPVQGSALVTVSRQVRGKNRPTPAITLSYSTSDGSATAGSDYTAASGTLNFPACSTDAVGCLSQTFLVPVMDDSTPEGIETVNLKLRPVGTTSVLVNPSTAILDIVDNDAGSGGTGSGPTFALAAASDDVSELNGTESIFILRTGNLASAASVDYATGDGTATAGSDYTGIPATTASFAVDQIYQQVNVAILHNTEAESTESFTFSLSNPSTGATTAAPTSEQVNIIDSDSPASFELGEPSYSVAENGGTLLATVRATGAIGNGGTTVSYGTADGTATAGSDYTAASGDLVFDPGEISQTVAVPILDDNTFENDETFGLSVFDSSKTWDDATATILEDDPAPPASNTGGSNPGGNGTGETGGTPAGGGEQVVLGARQSACGLVVKAAKKQKLLKSKALVLKVRSGQSCKVSLLATIKQVKSKKSKRKAQIVRALRFKGKKVSLSLQPGKAKTVKVRFTKRTLKAIKKALKAHKKLVATVVVSERDASAVVKKRTVKITIRR